jgi:hypothetical protein
MSVKAWQKWIAERRVHRNLKQQTTAIQVITAFIEAHEVAQGKIAAYFGDDADIDSPEEAFVIIESQVQVFKASTMSCAIDHGVHMKVNTMWKAHHFADEYRKFVHGVLDSGILNGKEAEGILHPIADTMRSWENERRQIFRNTKRRPSTDGKISELEAIMIVQKVWRKFRYLRERKGAAGTSNSDVKAEYLEYRKNKEHAGGAKSVVHTRGNSKTSDPVRIKVESSKSDSKTSHPVKNTVESSNVPVEFSALEKSDMKSVEDILPVNNASQSDAKQGILVKGPSKESTKSKEGLQKIEGSSLLLRRSSSRSASPKSTDLLIQEASVQDVQVVGKARAMSQDSIKSSSPTSKTSSHYVQEGCKTPAIGSPWQDPNKEGVRVVSKVSSPDVKQGSSDVKLVQKVDDISEKLQRMEDLNEKFERLKKQQMQETEWQQELSKSYQKELAEQIGHVKKQQEEALTAKHRKELADQKDKIAKDMKMVKEHYQKELVEHLRIAKEQQKKELFAELANEYRQEIATNLAAPLEIAKNQPYTMQQQQHPMQQMAQMQMQQPQPMQQMPQMLLQQPIQQQQQQPIQNAYQQPFQQRYLQQQALQGSVPQQALSQQLYGVPQQGFVAPQQGCGDPSQQCNPAPEYSQYAASSDGRQQVVQQPQAQSNSQPASSRPASSNAAGRKANKTTMYSPQGQAPLGQGAGTGSTSEHDLLYRYPGFYENLRSEAASLPKAEAQVPDLPGSIVQDVLPRSHPRSDTLITVREQSQTEMQHEIIEQEMEQEIMEQDGDVLA